MAATLGSRWELGLGGRADVLVISGVYSLMGRHSKRSKELPLFVAHAHQTLFPKSIGLPAYSSSKHYQCEEFARSQNS
jgi:hypothetical protein